MRHYRILARIVGIIWVTLVCAAGGSLIAAGHIPANRAYLYALFLAVLPGIGFYQWGKGPRATWRPASPSQPRPRASINRSAEAGHVFTLVEDPLELEKNEHAKIARSIADSSTSTPALQSANEGASSTKEPR
jgi:hypothetical protein